MNTAYKQCLGEVLAEKRRLAKVNKRQLSMMVGISRLTIRKIEEGATNPSLDVLLRITQGIGVSLADIVTECEKRLGALPEDELDSPYVLAS